MWPGEEGGPSRKGPTVETSWPGRFDGEHVALMDGKWVLQSERQGSP